MLRGLLVALALWVLSLLFSALMLGLSYWQAKGAVANMRRDDAGVSQVTAASSQISNARLGLSVAVWNPGVQVFRVVPGLTWLPDLANRGLDVVKAVDGLMDAGGKELLVEAMGGELTREPGKFDVEVARRIAFHAGGLSGGLAELRDAVLALRVELGPWWTEETWGEALGESTSYFEVADSVVALLEQLPDLLGADSAKNYFVGITNPAELRGVQGIIGQYAIVRVNNGAISVERVGSNQDLTSSNELPRGLQGDYASVYGTTNTEWVNMNLSPFFDHAALQITNGWLKQTGEHLDGVVLLDTVAFAKWVIPTVGSVDSANGRNLATWEALADYLSNGIYFEFPEDQLARKDFQTELASNVINAVIASPIDVGVLAKSLSEPLRKGRIVVWLNDANGAKFNSTFLARSANSLGDHDLHIGINNWTGNKLDFYLAPTFGLAARCVNGTGSAELTLKFVSTASPDVKYPDYLAVRLDLDEEAQSGQLSSFLDVTVVLPNDVTDVQATLDEDQIDAGIGPVLNGRAIVRAQIEVFAGQSSYLVIEFKTSSCLIGEVRLPPSRNVWQALQG
jgi:hypothetical protein